MIKRNCTFRSVISHQNPAGTEVILDRCIFYDSNKIGLTKTQLCFQTKKQSSSISLPSLITEFNDLLSHKEVFSVEFSCRFISFKTVDVLNNSFALQRVRNEEEEDRICEALFANPDRCMPYMKRKVVAGYKAIEIDSDLLLTSLPNGDSNYESILKHTIVKFLLITWRASTQGVGGEAHMLSIVNVSSLKKYIETSSLILSILEECGFDRTIGPFLFDDKDYWFDTCIFFHDEKFHVSETRIVNNTPKVSFTVELWDKTNDNESLALVYGDIYFKKWHTLQRARELKVKYEIQQKKEYEIKQKEAERRQEELRVKEEYDKKRLELEVERINKESEIRRKEEMLVREKLLKREEEERILEKTRNKQQERNRQKAKRAAEFQKKVKEEEERKRQEYKQKQRQQQQQQKNQSKPKGRIVENEKNIPKVKQEEEEEEEMKPPGDVTKNMQVVEEVMVSLPEHELTRNQQLHKRKEEIYRIRQDIRQIIEERETEQELLRIQNESQRIENESQRILLETEITQRNIELAKRELELSKQQTRITQERKQHQDLSKVLKRKSQEKKNQEDDEKVKQQEEKVTKLDVNLSCCVCLNKLPNIALIQCEHLCLCDECIPSLIVKKKTNKGKEYDSISCPLCRKENFKYLRVRY